MPESEYLSAVIGEIYDAAIDPSRWPSVLEQVCGFVGGFAASLFIHDAVTKEANFVCQWGATPESWEAYTSEYVKINPAFPTLLLKETGTVLANVDIVPENKLRLTRFYKEWLQPQGFVDTIGAVLEKSWTSCSIFAVLRGAEHGIVDESARQRMALLIPHIQRAVLIGKTIELKNVVNEDFALTLNALSTAVYLLSESREILHTNSSGAALRNADTILIAAGNVFQARDPIHEGQLRTMISDASAYTASAGRKTMAIELSATDGERYFAHILPLGLGTQGWVRSCHGAAFAVFIHQAALWRPTLVECVAERFQLTPAQIRVLFALLEVGGAAEAAPVLGISKDTVKSHLKHIFRKTGTKSQADLVKLVAEFASTPIL